MLSEISSRDSEIVPLMEGEEGFSEPLGDHIVQFLDGSIQDRHRTVRTSLQLSAIVISAAAKAPFWAVNQQLGPILGPIGGVANLGAFFILESWAAVHGLKDALGPKTQGELSMEGKKKPLCRTIVILSISTVTAGLSQLPSALAAAEYNAPTYKLAAAVMMIISGSLLPLRSIQLSIEATRNRGKAPLEEQLIQLKKAAISLLQDHLQKDPTSLQTLHKDLLAIKALPDEEERQEQYTCALFSSRISPQSAPVTQTARNIGEKVGILLNLFFQGTIGAYTYTLSKQYIKDDDATAAVFASTAVASSFYLMHTAVQKTAGRVFQSAYQFFSRQHTPTVLEQLRPKLLFSLKAAGLIFDLCALGASIVIWSDFYDQTKGGQIIGTTAMSSTIFFLLFTAMTDTLESITTQILLAKGTPEEKEVLTVYTHIHTLATAIERVPLPHVARWVLALNPTLGEPLLTKFDLSRALLQDYLAAMQPSRSSSLLQTQEV